MVVTETSCDIGSFLCILYIIYEIYLHTIKCVIWWLGGNCLHPVIVDIKSPMITQMWIPPCLHDVWMCIHANPLIHDLHRSFFTKDYKIMDPMVTQM